MRTYLLSILLFLSYSTLSGKNGFQLDPCQPLGYNIIANGDFEQGDLDFQSDLDSDPSCSNNTYTVFNSNDPDCTGSLLPDHTDGDGNYFSANINAFSPSKLWAQEVQLLEGQQYVFTVWVYGMGPGGSNVPILEVEVDGLLMGQTGSVFQSPVADGWTRFDFSYNSQSFTQAEISIHASFPNFDSGNSPFNVLLLDDISLSPVYPDARPCELIVQYTPGITEAEKEEIRSAFEITVEDSCVCDELDLWLVDMFPMMVDGELVFDMEGLKKGAKKKTGIQDVDFNYSTSNHAMGPSPSMPSAPGASTEAGHNGEGDDCTTIVAIIDTGVDMGHDALSSNSVSIEEPCPGDAEEGYNFVGNNNDIYDDALNGHGTHVAGIVSSFFEEGNPNVGYGLGLMAVKAQGSNGQGTIFDVMCATLFANGNGADVINMSLGYRGDSTAILYHIFEKTRLENEVVLVASAGNDGKNNDFYGHYPSNHSNVNLIAVAADTVPDIGAYLLTDYSCHGASTVDISAYGFRNSTVQNNGYADLRGTSMAAPQIAAAAAIAKRYDGWTAEHIKNLILSTGNPIHPNQPLTHSNLSFDMGVFAGHLKAMPCAARTDEDRSEGLSVFLYPNPVKETIHLDYPREWGELRRVDVRNALGKRMARVRFEDGVVHMPELPAGYYMLEMDFGKQKARSMFMKL